MCCRFSRLSGKNHNLIGIIQREWWEWLGSHSAGDFTFGQVRQENKNSQLWWRTEAIKCHHKEMRVQQATIVMTQWWREKEVGKDGFPFLFLSFHFPRHLFYSDSNIFL